MNYKMSQQITESNFSAQNNEIQYSYNHQNTGMTQPMIQTASSYHYNPSIPGQPQPLITANEDMSYAQDMASPYSFASSPLTHSNHSNRTPVYAQDYQYFQPQQQQQQSQMNNNKQYQREYVSSEHDRMSMHTYNDIRVQPQRYNYESTISQSMPSYHHRMSQQMAMHPGTHRQPQKSILMQQSLPSVHPDTLQRQPTSTYASQHTPRIPANKTSNTEIPMIVSKQQEIEPIKVAKDIEFYSIQQSILWRDLYKQYQISYSIYTKVKMLISTDYNGYITEDIVGTIKLEQMMNTEKFNKIMEQSYSKFILDQMKLPNKHFSIKNTADNNKRIDGIF